MLDIGIQIQKDVGGVEMGVLNNGIPFLTQNGLARVAGSSRSDIYDIAQEWAERFNDEILDGDLIWSASWESNPAVAVIYRFRTFIKRAHPPGPTPTYPTQESARSTSEAPRCLRWLSTRLPLIR